MSCSIEWLVGKKSYKLFLNPENPIAKIDGRAANEWLIGG